MFFAFAQNQKTGIQLAHAGQKASTVAPRKTLGMIAKREPGGGGGLLAPSAVAYSETFFVPREISRQEIEGLKRD